MKDLQKLFKTYSKLNRIIKNPALAVALMILVTGILLVSGLILDANSSQLPQVAGISVNQSFNLSETEYLVTDVVDGDTIKVVDHNEQRQTLRLIGIDTPETVAPGRAVECFGPEATAFAKDELLGQIVQLEFDISQGQYDRYDRLLVYVFVDGENFNLQAIEGGFATEYTYSEAYKYQQSFKAAESRAKFEQRGLWGEC